MVPFSIPSDKSAARGCKIIRFVLSGSRTRNWQHCSIKMNHHHHRKGLALLWPNRVLRGQGKWQGTGGAGLGGAGWDLSQEYTWSFLFFRCGSSRRNAWITAGLEFGSWDSRLHTFWKEVSYRDPNLETQMLFLRCTDQPDDATSEIK